MSTVCSCYYNEFFCVHPIHPILAHHILCNISSTMTNVKLTRHYMLLFSSSKIHLAISEHTLQVHIHLHINLSKYCPHFENEILNMMILCSAALQELNWACETMTRIRTRKGQLHSFLSQAINIYPHAYLFPILSSFFTFGTHLTCCLWLMCLSSAWVKSFSPVFSTLHFRTGNVLKGCPLCIGHKWDTHPNKW